MIQEKDPNVYKGNDYKPRLRLEIDDEQTGDPIAAVGIADLKMRIAATEDGPAIHASLEVPATEYSGRPGSYRGTIVGADIDTYLFGAGVNDYAGKDVWIIAFNTAGNVRGAQRVKALKVRRIS